MDRGSKTKIPLEKEAIATTLNYYLIGSMNRDFNVLKETFHENAIVTS